MFSFIAFSLGATFLQVRSTRSFTVTFYIVSLQDLASGSRPGEFFSHSYLNVWGSLFSHFTFSLVGINSIGVGHGSSAFLDSFFGSTGTWVRGRTTTVRALLPLYVSIIGSSFDILLALSVVSGSFYLLHLFCTLYLFFLCLTSTNFYRMSKVGRVFPFLVTPSALPSMRGAPVLLVRVFRAFRDSITIGCSVVEVLCSAVKVVTVESV